MAKLSAINKNNRRIKLSDKYYKKRTKQLSKLFVGLHGYFGVFNS